MAGSARTLLASGWNRATLRLAAIWSLTLFREKHLKCVFPFYTLSMQNEFTAVIERESLGAAIQLILEARREDGLRGAPADALRETVTIR